MALIHSEGMNATDFMYIQALFILTCVNASTSDFKALRCYQGTALVMLQLQGTGAI